MANILENVGEKTIVHLDYVGNLNIQWWATVRAMTQALPFVGNRYRWKTAVRQMLEIGVDAIPMVSLMAVCTGFIFAMDPRLSRRRSGRSKDRNRTDGDLETVRPGAVLYPQGHRRRGGSVGRRRRSSAWP